MSYRHDKKIVDNNFVTCDVFFCFLAIRQLSFEIMQCYYFHFVLFIQFQVLGRVLFCGVGFQVHCL